MNGDVIDETLNLFKKKDEMTVVHPETGETVNVRAYPNISGGENRGWIFYEPTRWPCPDNALGYIFCGNCKHFEIYSESCVKSGEEILPPGIIFDDNDKVQSFIGEDKEKHKERVISYCSKGKIKLSYNNSACDQHHKFHEPPPEDDLFEINKIRSDLTDIGNGQRLAMRHGKDLKYCHVWAKWLVWDGKRWDLDATAEIDRRAKETVFSIYIEASNDQLKKKDRDNIIQHAQRSESNRALKAMLEMASSENGIVVRQESLDNDKYTINLRNYTLDLKDLKHYEHSRDDLITKIANVDYNIDAECPKWREFLNLIFNNDQETINYVQKACGYSLSGDIGEQKVFFLCGNGENGKSTFLDTIMAILGDYAMSCPTETFMVKDFGGNGPNNDLARLKGARFVTAAEIESGKKLAESLVKQVTGGDKIAARYLRQEYFEFTPEFKLWFCTNHKPDIGGTDHGIWRRVKIIPFDIIVPKKLQELGRPAVKNYHEVMIKEEASGILNWMLQGWILWMREGLKDSEAIKEATNEYRAEMDVLGRFIEECCIVMPGVKVLYKDLYARYIVWFNENNGNSKYAMGDRKFATMIREKGFTKKPGASNQKYWHGITVTEKSVTVDERVTELPKVIEFTGLNNKHEGQAVKPVAGVMYSNSVTLSLSDIIKEQTNLMSEKLYEGYGVPQTNLIMILIKLGYEEEKLLNEIKTLLEIGELVRLTSNSKYPTYDNWLKVS